MNTKRLLTAAAAIALLAGAAHAQSMPAPAPQAPAAASPVVAKGDLIDTATASGQFSTFLKAVSAVNLTSVLKANQNLTLFAPTDAAFAALPAGELDKLMLPENGPMLQKVLTYHLINAKVDSTKIKGAKGEVKSVEGSSLLLDGSGATPMVDGATITQTDVMASNGVLHVVDKVLIPKDVPGLQASAAPAATDAGATMNVAANEQMAPAAPADQAAPAMPADPAQAAPTQASDMAADPAASPSATSAPASGVNTSGVVPVSSQSPDAQASLKAGDPNVVSNPPVADTPENRAKYGKPMSNAGKRTAPKGN
uniref:fasciclin domain-containing protein n=1 Tax=uncultured Caulobacter sp. TaxID=158749 RepID=UPI0025DA56B6|nr:fasciclin domain-containing protein [uncultured Caulobacter sp.]